MNIENNTTLLIDAAEQGDAAEVQRLIPISNPKADYSAALRLAAGSGHIECVQLLIPVSEPKERNSEALRWAAECGYSGCVELLIPVSDLKSCSSYALRGAVFNGHKDCIDILFDVSDFKSVLHDLKKQYFKEPEVWMYLEEKVIERQREILNNVTTQQNVQTCIKNTRKI